MPLTLMEANRMMEGAIAKAREFRIEISVAVCDPGGRLIALNTMDGACMAATFAAQGKALASAAFGRPTSELAPLASSPLVAGINAAVGGHMILSGGALPIFRNGRMEGACGIAGGTDQQDEECAMAGAARL